MDFKKVVEERRSVRDYDSSKEITDSQLEQLFSAVKLSPSSYNLQPWEFVVVRKNKKKLFDCTNNQQHVLGASATIIVLANTNPLAHADDIMEDRVKKGYYSAEQKALTIQRINSIASDKTNSLVWAVKSTSLAAMTLMLAAVDMGLSTCPIESFNKDAVRKEFNIPDNYEIIMLITLGYQSKEPKERLKRYGYGEIVHLEGFGNKKVD